MSKRPAASTISDLLVVLGTQRYGTDWTNVAAAIRAAAGPLDSLEPPPPAECEERFRALVEGMPVELPTLAAKLQARHLQTLGEARSTLCRRIEELCSKLPSHHPSRAAFLAGAADKDAIDAAAGEDGGDDGDSRHGGSGRTRTSGTPEAGQGESSELGLDEHWVAIAEDEERNARRSTVAGTLNKMLSSIARHKWAYPFKRPVTEKEAPDYREIIETPMDFATLKRRVETGQVADLHALCDDLNLIFENAMKYNGEGTDYYKMASTLRSIVANQKAQYLKLRGDSIEVKGAAGGAGGAPGGAPGGGASGATAPAAPAVPAAPADESDKAPRRGRVPRR